MSSEAEIRQLVERLREQLAALDQVDPEVRALLEAADDDIQAALGGPEAAPATLRERLKSAAEHFEDEHPALTATLGGIVDALARIGI